MPFDQQPIAPPFDVDKATQLLSTTRRPVPDIAKELGCTTNQLREWMPYSGVSRQKLWGNNRAPGLGPAVARSKYVARRLSANERERQIYGALLDDVKFLRTRGFVIVRERTHFLVDWRHKLSAPELTELAARERRLIGSNS